MIRAATKADYPSYATLFRELGTGDPVPAVARWLAKIAPNTLVSERAGHVEGYVTFFSLNHAAAHVRELVVADHARGAGVGGELMTATAQLLRSSGVGEWHLNVTSTNAPAIKLYERLGMREEHRSTIVRLGWQTVAALPREAMTALPVAAEEDDDIERALGLLAGRIAMSRMQDDRVLVQLRDAACAPVGFAAFDPKIPGAMPFRVARPELAGTLLDALLPHARGHDYIQLVLEDDAALAESLIAAGAEVRKSLLHFRGALERVTAANVSR